jgi:hypothetical protein
VVLQRGSEGGGRERPKTQYKSDLTLVSGASVIVCFCAGERAAVAFTELLQLIIIMYFGLAKCSALSSMSQINGCKNLYFDAKCSSIKQEYENQTSIFKLLSFSATWNSPNNADTCHVLPNKPKTLHYPYYFHHKSEGYHVYTSWHRVRPGKKS